MSEEKADAEGVEEDSLQAIPQLNPQEEGPNGATGPTPSTTTTTPTPIQASKSSEGSFVAEDLNGKDTRTNPSQPNSEADDTTEANESDQIDPDMSKSSPNPSSNNAAPVKPEKTPPTTADVDSDEVGATQPENTADADADEETQPDVTTSNEASDDTQEVEEKNEKPSEIADEQEGSKSGATELSSTIEVEKKSDAVEKPAATEEDSLMETEFVDDGEGGKLELESSGDITKDDLKSITVVDAQGQQGSSFAEAEVNLEASAEGKVGEVDAKTSLKEAETVVDPGEEVVDFSRGEAEEGGGSVDIKDSKPQVNIDDSKKGGGLQEKQEETIERPSEVNTKVAEAGTVEALQDIEQREVREQASFGEESEGPQQKPAGENHNTEDVSASKKEINFPAPVSKTPEESEAVVERGGADAANRTESLEQHSTDGTSAESKSNVTGSLPCNELEASGAESEGQSVAEESSPLLQLQRVGKEPSLKKEPRKSNLSVDTTEDAERRDSIVSSTEVITSPGGTKTMNVALTQISAQSTITTTSKPARAEFNKKHSEGVFNAVPAARPHVAVDEDYDLVREDSSIDWKDMDAMEAEQDAMVDAFSRKLELEREKNEVHESRSIDAESVDSVEELMQAVKLQQQKSASKASLDSAKTVEPEPPVNADLDLDLAAASSEKDRQIQTLQDQLMRALRGDCCVIDELDSSVAVDQRDAKIVDLAKKNRSLHLTLERDRLKARQLESKLLQAEDSLRTCKRELQLEKQKHATGKQSGDANLESDRRRDDKSSIRQLQQQVDSARLKAEQSSLESKRLRRLLIREVGEGPALDKVLESLHLHSGARNGSGDTTGELVGWRGRAQQILKLKAKVRELSRELDEARQEGANGYTETPTKRRGLDVDSRAMEEVKYIERGRRHSMQKLVHEMEEVEERYTETRRKADASRARNKVLENDNKKMREQMKVLLSKTTNDDALVDALRREIKRLRSDYSSAKGKVQMLETGTVSQLAYEELRQHSQSQAAQIERQDELLVKMRRQVESAQSNAGRKLIVKTNEELDAQAHHVNNKLLKVECDRLNELVDMFRRKLEEGMAEKESALVRSKAAEHRVVQLERRLGNIGLAGRKRQPPADQFLAMKDSLHQLKAENAALKERCARRIASKDEEIRVVRSMGEEMKRTYEEAISEMKRQVQMATSEAHRRASKLEDTTGSSLVQHLTHENEYLRGEISDLRDRQFGSSPSKYTSSPKSFHSPYNSPNRKLLARPSKPYR